MMMGKDKKKMAMLIIGKKEDDKDMDMKKDEYKEEDMGKEAAMYCLKGFLKAVEHEDMDKALEKFKKLVDLTKDLDEEEEEEEKEKEEY